MDYQRKSPLDYKDIAENLRNPAWYDLENDTNLLDDAATAITDLLARAEKAERERDTAVRDLRQMCVGGNTCAFCEHGRNCGKQGSGRKTVEPCREWRGPKEE